LDGNVVGELLDETLADAGGRRHGLAALLDVLDDEGGGTFSVMVLSM
jgi:hypothetical protein